MLSEENKKGKKEKRRKFPIKKNRRKQKKRERKFPIKDRKKTEEICRKVFGNGKVERAEEKDSHQHGNGEVERAAENDSHAPNADEGRIGPNQHDNHIEHEVKRHENEHIGEFPEQVIRNWHQESMLRSAVGVLRKNKGIVVTAVIAFSLGLFVSHKFNSTGP